MTQDQFINESTRQAASYQLVMADIYNEILKSNKHQRTFSSLHEAYAVILEEVDELWKETIKKRKDRAAIPIHDELVQIAAMAIKATFSMDNFVGGDV